jgi:hypothetical protein
VKYWEIIADRLHAEGWSYGIAEHFTKDGFLFCVDAHRDGKRFIVKADDLLTALLSLERDVIAPKRTQTATEQRSLAWRCTSCGYIKHFTRPATAEVAPPCPKCQGSRFEPH